MSGESLGKACMMVFLALFTWPVLRAFDVPGTVLGVPSFLAWLFLVWAGLVYVLAAASRRMEE